MVVLCVAASGVGAACQNPNPQPTPPSPVTPAVIYGELVEGGCMKADPDGGVAAVAGELSMSKPPAWIVCLAEAGTITGCGVPCTPPKP
jgi:hypothetical protein